MSRYPPGNHNQRLNAACREWRDPTATTVQPVQSGINDTAHRQRQSLFGKNEIEIDAKPTWTLLVEEVCLSSCPIVAVVHSIPQVVHPFYVFQIASIILWSLDDYYYYAFCIALISLASITSTLIDTKRVRLKSLTPSGVISL